MIQKNLPDSGDAARYDVAIIGGALSGAATATLLLQENPDLRVLIIEKSEAFSRRVGEATIEISTFLLYRMLGLADHLNEHHYVKQGLRFWFHNERTQNLGDCSEIGGKFLSRVPAFLVDRAVMDEEVLRRAVALGAECRRPARLVKIELVPGGEQRLTVRNADGSEQNILARWAVDASGVAAVLARQQGWHRQNEAHPTAALWSRWSGVKNWDGPEFCRRYPEWAAACHGMRNMATNHLMGDGWWSWWIPLKGGDVSVGLVYDQRLVTLPPGPNLGERLREFLTRNHPAARELLADAHWHEGDVNYRKNLPYYSTTYAGDGFSLVGDAAGFIDPFYSPGLDWITFTAKATVDLILAERRGETDIPKRLERHNRDFVRCYQRWFEAIYQDKYEYMGDFELLRIAFLFDLGLYYIFVAAQPFLHGAKMLIRPIYSLPPSTPFFWFMRFYNRRMAAMARVRRARGVHGRRNAGQRFLFPGFAFSIASGRPMFKAWRSWIWLEITEGWRSWGRRRETQSQPDARPVSATAPRRVSSLAADFPPLDELLPHRPPMRLLRAVLAHAPGETRCEARFDEAFAQACGGEPSAAFALELIAQAAAVHHGLLRRRETLSRPKRGLLLGSRRLELCVRALPVNEALTVIVLGGESPPGVGGLIRFEGRVEDAAGKVLARGDATVLEGEPQTQMA